MKTYIEVSGEAILLEQVSLYRAELSLSVRTVKEETALKEAGELRDACIKALFATGILSDELREGGSQSWRPWYMKKKPGQETSFKLLLSCREAVRLYTALEALQDLFENPRHSLSVSMPQPEFFVSDEAKAVAQAAAIRHARQKAEILAREAGVGLSQVLRIQELDTYSSRDFCEVAGSADEGMIELEGTKRSSKIRYRVRFGISAKES